MLLCSVVVVAGAVVASPARAAACPLIKDPARDVESNPWLVEREMPNVDLRSVDFTSNAHTVTAIIRVTQLAAMSVDTPFGARWEARFEARGSNPVLHLWAEVAGGAPQYFAAEGDERTTRTIAAVEGTFDVARSEVRIAAPLDVFDRVLKAPLRKGTMLDAVEGRSARFITPETLIAEPMDSTWQAKHRVGTSPCGR